MSLLSSPLAGLFILVILLGLFSAAFFYFIPIQVDKQKTSAMRHFFLFYILMVAGCFIYIMRDLLTDQGSSIVNGLLYITSSFALRHGFEIRKNAQIKSLFHNKYYWICVVIIIVVNGYLLHDVYKSMWMRITVMNVIFTAITLSILPLITLEQKVTNGEKVAKAAIYIIAFIFSLAPIIYFATQNVHIYVLYTVLCQGLSSHIWLGCLCALMMSDVLQTHYNNSIKDALTGIYNRRYFIESATDLSKKQSESNALIICDLDDFKVINDTYGHDTGDMVLIEFAKLLQANISRKDIVARIGGEEFAILLHGVTLNEAENIAKRMCQLTKTISIQSKQNTLVQTSASFGVCKFGKNVQLKDVLHCADSAMYSAKNAGKSQVHVYQGMQLA